MSYGEVNYVLNRFLLGFAVVAVTVLGLWGCPRYNVYFMRMQGEAELAKARGIAESNRVLNESVKNNPELIHYFFVKGIGQNRGTVYVPTEANLPIPEATRKTK